MSSPYLPPGCSESDPNAPWNWGDGDNINAVIRLKFMRGNDDSDNDPFRIFESEYGEEPFTSEEAMEIILGELSNGYWLIEMECC